MLILIKLYNCVDIIIVVIIISVINDKPPAKLQSPAINSLPTYSFLVSFGYKGTDG